MAKWYDESIDLKNIVCFQMLKFDMYKDLQKLYRKYLSGELGGDDELDPPEYEPLDYPINFAKDRFEDWQENFNTNIFDENFEIWGFEENFQDNWFIDNQFNNILNTETFENDWFTINQFDNNIMNDNFDDNWFIDNDYSQNVFSEDWENGGW